MKNILLIEDGATQKKELERLREQLQESGKFNVEYVVLNPQTYKLGKERLRRVFAPRNRLSAKWFPIYAFLGVLYAMLRVGCTLAKLLLYAVKMKRIIQPLLKSKSFTAIVIVDEPATIQLFLTVRSAAKMNIPTVVIPYSISNESEPLESYKDNPRHIVSKRMTPYIKKLFPRWCRFYEGNLLIRLPIESIIIWKLFNLQDDNPWMYCTGYSRAVVATSEFHKQYLQRSGVPSEKIINLGTLCDDVLATSFLKRKARKERTDEVHEKPLLLCGLPPDQSRETVYGSYTDFLLAWADCLLKAEKAGWQVVVRPHPAVKDDAVQLLKDKGLSVSFEDTASLIPIADIYFTSISSTIRWALACGVPVINHDIYMYNYSDFEDASGIFTTIEPVKMQVELERLINNLEELGHVQRALSKEREFWGYLDGKNGDRLLSFLDSIDGVEIPFDKARAMHSFPN